MDQLSPLYDAPAEGIFTFHSGSEKNLSYYQLYALLQTLTANIDIKPLLSAYFIQALKHLPIDGISLDYQNQQFQCGHIDNTPLVESCDIKIGYQKVAHLRHYAHSQFSQHQAKLLKDIQNCLQQPLKMAIQHDQVKRLCFKDNLTGLGNRSQYNETVGRSISHALRNEDSFGLLILDLDHFKQANDQYGHLLGDQILIAFANVLQDCLRDTDFAFRFGGDEFCCLLENANELLNQKVSIRIINGVTNHPLLVQHGITCSIGSALFSAEDTAHSLFQRADEAMYAAKLAGKNCIKCA
ncbi:GGDEF domain-containing protein [Neptunicella sp. SCSIO 80796]|uniref:GGDEF domain-containing protein n=1 Tax=Neptunicella plasticusilytica TaxID=3117012 RepID=UPI003A4D4079